MKEEIKLIKAELKMFQVTGGKMLSWRRWADGHVFVSPGKHMLLSANNLCESYFCSEVT
jgi:hypothetical protein